LGELKKESILFLLLPAILVSAIVNIIVGAIVGLYASRKYAVPIYKLEQWVALLRQGNMTAQLRFREKEEMKELSQNCNMLCDELRQKFVRIKVLANALTAKDIQPEPLTHLLDIISKLDLDAEPIEVHTSFIKKAR
jgi:nitrogen fixation/metabolism regulation signal transduction histidine kinase